MIKFLILSVIFTAPALAMHADTSEPDLSLVADCRAGHCVGVYEMKANVAICARVDINGYVLKSWWLFKPPLTNEGCIASEP